MPYVYKNKKIKNLKPNKTILLKLNNSKVWSKIILL